MADTMFGTDPALLQQALQQQQQQSWQQDIQSSPFELMQRAGNQAGGMLGNALGAATGYVDPRIADAQLMQRVQQESLAEAQAQGINPAQDPAGFGKVMANKYLQIGKPDKAYAVLQQIQGMEKITAETKLKSAQAEKALREEIGPAHLSDLGKYQFEYDKVLTALEQDPTNPRLQAMKTNYEAKIKRFSQGDEGALARDVSFLQSRGMPEQVAIGIKSGVLSIVPTADGGVKILDKRDILAGKEGKPVWSTSPQQGQQPQSQFQGQQALPGEIASIPGYKPQERLDKAVVDIGQDLEKAKLTDQMNVLRDVTQKYDALRAKGNVPGIGQFESGLPTWMIPSAEGRALRDSLQQLFNITLKDRSGAAVTNQEMERLKKEFASGAFRSEDDMRSAMQRMGDIILKHEQSLIDPYPEEAKIEFIKRTGRQWTVNKPQDVRILYKANRITKDEARALLTDMEKEGIK